MMSKWVLFLRSCGLWFQFYLGAVPIRIFPIVLDLRSCLIGKVEVFEWLFEVAIVFTHRSKFLPSF